MKVLLIDDHPLILSALQTVIQGLGDDVTVVGVGSARAARETLAADADFDLVLLDLHLGDADGFDVLTEFRNAYPALPVVVVSASTAAQRRDPRDRPRRDGLRAQARQQRDAVRGAAHGVMSGGIYVPPMTMGGVDRRRRRRRRRARARIARRTPGRPGRHPEAARRWPNFGLTPRQTDVLGAAAAGQAEQADRARAEPVGRDGQGPRRRGAARARRQLAHAGGAGGEPDVAARGRSRLAHAAPCAAAREARSARSAAPQARRAERARRRGASLAGRERRARRSSACPTITRGLRVQPATLIGYAIGIVVI